MGMFDHDEQETITISKFEYTSMQQRSERYQHMYENAERMLLNICDKVYQLKGGYLSVDQLMSIVNGCLSPSIVDRWTYKYLFNGNQKEDYLQRRCAEINEEALEDLSCPPSLIESGGLDEDPPLVVNEEIIPVDRDSIDGIELEVEDEVK